jgi:beta-glucosidase
MVRGLRERGIMPLVTLHHFTDPLWIYQQRGWERDISKEFAAYTKKIVEALKEYVSVWCTINEPNVYSFLGYLSGEFPPGQNSLVAAYKVMTNLLRGHAAAYEVIHQIQPDAQVGLAHHYRSMQPRRPWFGPDKWVAAWQSRAFNDFYAVGAATGMLRYPFGRRRMKAVRGTQDYFGLNYYTEDYVSFNPFAVGDMFGKRSFAEDAQLSPTGWIANVPTGMYKALQWANQFGLPIYVTENGIEDGEDRLRPRYLVEHIHQMWRGVNYGFPVKGYFHWSLVDNFEWERGWTQRFGLWALDEKTQARTMRPSAELFSEICKANALSSSMVERFAPAALPAMFPV